MLTCAFDNAHGVVERPHADDVAVGDGFLIQSGTKTSAVANADVGAGGETCYICHEVSEVRLLLAHEAIVFVIAVGERKSRCANGCIDLGFEFVLHGLDSIPHGLVDSFTVASRQKFVDQAIVFVDGQTTYVGELRGSGSENNAVATVVGEFLVQKVMRVAVKNDINTVGSGNQSARIGDFGIIAKVREDYDDLGAFATCGIYRLLYALVSIRSVEIVEQIAFVVNEVGRRG